MSLLLAMLVLLRLGSVRQTPCAQRAGCDTVVDGLLRAIAQCSPTFQLLVPVEAQLRPVVVAMGPGEFGSSAVQWTAFVHEIGLAAGASCRTVLSSCLGSLSPTFRRVGFVLLSQVRLT